jgi:hypothetical protein
MAPGGAPAVTPVPGTDPLAAGGAPVDPALAAQIQDVKASVDALATAAGIQTSDFGADPNAAVPPVDGMGADGMGAADPNAGAAPIMESMIRRFTRYVRLKEKRNPTEDELKRLREKVEAQNDTTRPKTKVDQLRERILERERLLREGNAAQELGKKVLSNIGGPQAKASFEPDKSGSPGDNKDVAGNPELVNVPSASKLAAGYASGPAEKPAKTWPTKAVTGKGVTAPLQGAGASQKGGETSPKVKESEEKTDEEKNALQESVHDVTQVYVDKELGTPKLDFQKLKEALSTGMLG